MHDLDINSVLAELSQSVNYYLKDVTAETVSDLSVAVKEKLNIILEKYSYDVYNYYVEGNNAMTDTKALLKFTDICDGYLAQMKSWAKANEIGIQYANVPTYDIRESPETYAKRINVIATGVGAVGTTALVTAHVKALSFLGYLPLAIIIELVGVALLYQAAKNKKAKYHKELTAQRSQYQYQIKVYKQKLEQAICDCAREWLGCAIAESDRIVKSLNTVK